MTLDQFNGLVRVLSITRINGGFFDLRLSFQDKRGTFNGSNVEIGDMVYIRGLDGKGYRLTVTQITLKSFNFIECRVQPDSPIWTFQMQGCVIVRETTNWKYPMFPQDTPKPLLTLMLNHYAILADRLDGNTEGVCSGNLITAGDVKGTETICLENEDGTKSKISLSELRKYMHTWKTPTGTDYYFKEVSEAGQMMGSTPPQY